MGDKNNIDWNKAKQLFAPDKISFSSQFRDKINQYPRAKTVLVLLAAGCILGFSAVSPAAPLAFHSIFKVWQSFNQRRLRASIRRFRKQKLVDVEEENGEYIVKVTSKGLTKALSYKLNEMAIREPKNWDGKWRVIIFDISNQKRNHRDIFRNYIKSLGLYQLQRSVYCYPYPCFDQVEFLRQIFQVGWETKYLLVEKIEDDETLRNHFQV
ncbi:MAG: hypothetical protein M1120_02515 [Patescibacteria group bacterium]|nr:hypothetical protein [Patescibacteria group bacterium]